MKVLAFKFDGHQLSNRVIRTFRSHKNTTHKKADTAKQHRLSKSER